MQITIISTNSAKQESYWQEKLKDNREIHPIVIEERWPGGAGNALGSLYTYLKALEKGKTLYGFNLDEKLKQGASIAMLHTAGLGIRLFPLTPSEHNDKSAIKLPILNEKGRYLTILEAVIRQAKRLTETREGRLSVFWGDQIFLPEKIPPAAGHAEIFAIHQPHPSEEEWNRKGLDRYGLLLPSPVRQLEKIDYATYASLIRQGAHTEKAGIGLSLGSFSLSYDLLHAFLNEFEPELQTQNGRLNTDPHLWMPLTLEKPLYLQTRKSRGEDPSFSEQHFERMQKFQARFREPLLTISNLGEKSSWWDFGNLHCYFRNLLKLTANTPEGEKMRAFFRVEQTGTSIVTACELQGSQVTNSILAGVHARDIAVDGCIMINSRIGSCRSSGSLIYNVSEQGELDLSGNAVRSDIISPYLPAPLPFYTTLERNSKSDWEIVLPGNRMSYREIYELLSR